MALPVTSRAHRRRKELTADERRFALGTRCVADLVAPAAVEVSRDHLRLDAQFVRILVVTGYPRTVVPGWLSPLIDFEEPLEISLHLYPLETAQMVSALSHKMVQLHSSRLLAARDGRLPDPEREVAYEDTERLRDALQRGEEKIFSVGLYILLRAGSLAALDTLTRKVELTLGSMLAHSRVAVLEQDAGFQSCLPQGQDRLFVYRNLDTSSLATTFPFSSSSLSMERGVLYGIALHNHSPVIVDPFDERLENANLAVFATSGAGKSYFTKLMALRNLLVDVEFLVIDPEDEYRALCAAVDGQYIRLASTSGQHLNPFDLPPSTDEAEGRDPLAEQVAALLALLEIMLTEPGSQLTPHERAVLDRALYQTYARAGITGDVSIHGPPVPLLRDLFEVLEESPGEVAASLATRLQRYVEGSLAGLFSAPTNVALDRRFVVFNIQALEPELRPLGIHLIASFVWNQVRRSRKPRLLIIDETKCQKYAGSYAARAIVGQPRSTVDPLGWLRSGAIVIVNTAKGTVGEGTAALLGATLLNLIALGIAEQAGLDPHQRSAATLMVDEFHTMPGADYEGILTELAKYGASLVLATQSLATLEALDRDRDRALRARVFANLDGLFAFHTSAEDARYLVPELGEEIDVQDLVGLGEHQCYVKLSLAGERLPTFSVRLDPPPQSDPAQGRHLALASAVKYGRERAAVEHDLRSARARIELSQAHWPKGKEPADKPKDSKSAGTQGAEQSNGKATQRSKKHSAPVDEVITQQPLFKTETGETVRDGARASPEGNGEDPVGEKEGTQ